MRVAVTRPLPDADRTARLLADLGHSPLVAPVLVTRPSGEPAPDGSFDALLATSAHAGEGLASLRPRLGDRPVFAVGTRSAAAAEAAGFRAVAAGGDAADLADLVARTLPPGAALLHVAGRDRKAEPGRSLRRAGFRVTAWTSYAADPAPSLPPVLADALRRGGLDAALHYSRRSAAILVELAMREGLGDALAALAHVVLSGDVAAALAPLGTCRVVVSTRPDEAALLDALVGAVAPVSPSPGSRC